MTMQQFHNALRVMRSIDFSEIEHVLNRAEWFAYRDNPYEFFTRCDDYTAAAIWDVMEGRMK